MTELNGSSQHFYSNKPSIQIAPSDDISQKRQMANMGTPSSLTKQLDQYSPGMKQNSFDYQLTQEKPTAKTRVKPAGKIILKKINHFTDNQKLN
jgi:hypothetical protein